MKPVLLDQDHSNSNPEMSEDFCFSHSFLLTYCAVVFKLFERVISVVYTWFLTVKNC